MSTSAKGGDTIKHVKVAKDSTKSHFIAFQLFTDEVKNKSVKDSNRGPHFVHAPLNM